MNQKDGLPEVPDLGTKPALAPSGPRVPQEQLHPVLEEGNKTPAHIVKILAEYAQREPPANRGLRIALGLTILREVDGKWAMRWMQALRSHWWPGPIYNGKGQYTVMARNYVLRQAFDDLDSWDALLFWDSDNVPPLVVPGPLPNGWSGGWFLSYLDYLVQTQEDKAVIGGFYPSREDYWQTDQLGKVKAGPHEPIAYRRNPDGTYGFLSMEEVVPMLQRPNLYPIGGVGTGTMLIRKETLLDLAELKAPKPVFEAPELKPGESGGGPGSQWTEDLYFCHEVATRLKKTIWLDSALQSAHIAEVWITFAHYLEARGISTQPHEQSLKRPINQSQENERRRSRIILPR